MALETKYEIKLNDLYREVILDHYRNPRFRKPIANPDVEEFGVNPLCGDEITIQLCFGSQCARNISNVAVTGRGCSICTASGSILAELINGKPIDSATRLISLLKDVMHGRAKAPLTDFGDLEALEGIKNFPIRIKCALLPWTTLEGALKQRERMTC